MPTRGKKRKPPVKHDLYGMTAHVYGRFVTDPYTKSVGIVKRYIKAPEEGISRLKPGYERVEVRVTEPHGHLTLHEIRIWDIPYEKNVTRRNPV